MQDKVVVSTVNEEVVTSDSGLEIFTSMLRNMQEADGTIFVHVKHTSKEDASIIIKTLQWRSHNGDC